MRLFRLQMKTNPREILIYYNPGSSSDRKAIAYAKVLSHHVRYFSHFQANCTSTQWRGILDKLELEPKRLFNKAHPEYQTTLKGKEFDDEGWLDVIKNNPHLLRSPIAIKGKKAVMCDSPTDILRL